jgi:TetR/AcrR family transcriptional repressor of bet genes
MLALHRELWGRYRGWIEKLIRQAAAERGLDIDARLQALAFTQLIDGLWLGWVMEDAYSLEDCRRILRTWLFDLFDEDPDRYADVGYGEIVQIV